MVKKDTAVLCQKPLNLNSLRAFREGWGREGGWEKAGDYVRQATNICRWRDKVGLRNLFRIGAFIQN